MFVRSPYRQACEAWDVPAADPAVAQPVDTDVPLLMLPGQFDSFSPPAVAEAQAARLPLASTIAVPGQTHNTLGFADCAITARNEWAQDPTDPARRGRLSRRPAARLQHRELSQFGEGDGIWGLFRGDGWPESQ